MRYVSMIELLSRGSQIRRLAKTSEDVLQDLHNRVCKGEIVLSYDDVLGDVVGDYWSVRTAIEADGWELREIGRINLLLRKKPIPHPEPKPYGATETALPHERGQPLLTAERCFREEWGVTNDEYTTVQMLIGSPEKHHSDDARFKGVLCLDHLNPSPEEPEVHTSSLYPMLSRVHISNTRLVMPTRRWKGGRRLKDGHVILLLEWFPVYEVVASHE